MGSKRLGLVRFTKLFRILDLIHDPSIRFHGLRVTGITVQTARWILDRGAMPHVQNDDCVVYDLVGKHRCYDSAMDLKQHIRGIADFPKPGIFFYDISTLLEYTGHKETPSRYNIAHSELSNIAARKLRYIQD